MQSSCSISRLRSGPVEKLAEEVCACDHHGADISVAQLSDSNGNKGVDGRHPAPARPLFG